MRHRLEITCISLLLLALSAFSLQAHELRPGYLDLRQTDEETFEIFWKVPARGEMRLSIDAQLPSDCVLGPKRSRFTDEAWIERWTARCPGGLVGKEISIGGLSATKTDVLVRMERSNKTSQVMRLTPLQPDFVVESSANLAQVARAYTALGIGHILLGFDHLLFLAALLLIVRGWRRMLGTVTAFTLAHSLTLAAATLGWVHIPQAPVEAVIALSIAFVAAEILRSRKGEMSLTEKKPWIVAFLFGLLHGLGFAGALAEVGLPQTEIPIALLAFNLGVELGQIFFIAVLFSIFGLLRRIHLSLPRWGVAIPPYAIGGLAMFWVIQRVAAF